MSNDSAQGVEASARLLLDQGQTFLAYDLVQTGLRRFPGSLGLKHAGALALLRAGALPEAQALLSDLGDRQDEESLGLSARVAKEIWKRSGRPEDAGPARDAYRRGFERSGGTWTGINAASLSWVIGERGEAVRLAGRVLDACAAIPLPADDAERYWRMATAGEALLLLERAAEAEAAFAGAVAVAGRRYASVATTRQQVQALADHGLPVSPSVLETLRPPTVVVFAGHMLDRPERTAPRFPPSLEGAVRAGIARHLGEMDARIGYSSAACGSDLLFAEEMLARGAELHIVLPYADEDFLRASVDFAGPDWVARFHHILARADSVRRVTEESMRGDDVVFGVMGQILRGYASLAAEPLEAAPTLLAVWDGRPSTLAGGTADLISRWPDPDRLRIIPIPGAPSAHAPPRAGAAAAAHPASGPAPNAPIRRQIKTLLFADVVGYSKLQEDATPAFMFRFLQRVAEHLPRTPQFVNTWGDAIFAIMDAAAPMAEYAHALQEVVCDTDWSGLGLPSAMSVRIGLHAGPVFEGIDPITGMVNYYGSHVNRAARIETVTVPGNIYLSEQFAALLMAEQDAAHPRFACGYIGTLALAKDFGRSATYHLRRR